MDAFLEVFFSIDKDRNEEITIQELQTYAEENDFEDGFVENWLDTFDEDHGGTISLEEFCKKLGLILRDARSIRDKNSKKRLMSLGALPDNVKVLFEDMELWREHEILEIIEDAWKKHPDSATLVAEYVKDQLEARHGEQWHVFMPTYQFSLYCSHEPGNAFNFKLGRYIYLIWKTSM